MDNVVDINTVYNNVHKKLKAIGIPQSEEGLFKTIQSLAFIGLSNKQYSKEEIPGTMSVYAKNKAYVDKVLNTLYASLKKTYGDKLIELEGKDGKKTRVTADTMIENAKKNLETLDVKLPKNQDMTF